VGALTGVLLLISLLACDRYSHPEGGGTRLGDTPSYVPDPQHPEGAYDWTAGPITALFNQGTFSTTYELSVHASDTFSKDLAAQKTHLTVVWSGPNCGGTTDLGGRGTTPTTWTYTFTWAHPHPPCAAGNHGDVTVKVDILGSTMRAVSCFYTGADSGTQNYCHQ
jgi:hypothetical protein